MAALSIGTLFSLAVLSVMITFAMQMLTAITATYIAQYVASMATSGALSTDGLNSMALQQGGIGLILTTLTISAPPMAAAFFQGTLGQFGVYSAFGRVGEGNAAAREQTALGNSPSHTTQGNIGQNIVATSMSIFGRLLPTLHSEACHYASNDDTNAMNLLFFLRCPNPL